MFVVKSSPVCMYYIHKFQLFVQVCVYLYRPMQVLYMYVKVRLYSKVVHRYGNAVTVSQSEREFCCLIAQANCVLFCVGPLVLTYGYFTFTIRNVLTIIFKTLTRPLVDCPHTYTNKATSRLPPHLH
jgi:hypothetical protein